MNLPPTPTKRHGKVSARDALVFLVIALVALVLIEGIVISNAALPAGTATQVSTVTILDTVTGNGTTNTVVSNQTSTTTVTSTASPSTETVTTTVGPGTPYTVTSTSTTTYTSTSTFSNTTTETDTSTVTSTITSTSTTTVTSSNSDSRSYVYILPGTAASGGINGTSGYDPDSVVVKIGTNNTVTWVNGDSVDHSVTSTSSIEPFNSGQIPPGGTYTFTFTVPGTYTYVCLDFPWMNGTVTVLSK